MKEMNAETPNKEPMILGVQKRSGKIFIPNPITIVWKGSQVGVSE